MSTVPEANDIMFSYPGKEDDDLRTNLAILCFAVMHLLDHQEVDVEALVILRYAQRRIVAEHKIKKVEDELDGKAWKTNYVTFSSGVCSK